MRLTLHRGEVLFRQGDPGTYLYRIMSGVFKVTRLHENGNILLFNLLFPGEIVPHHSLLSAKDCHGTATALTTSEVERIPADDWYAELAKQPEKAIEVGRVLQDKLRFMQQRIDHLTIGSPAERLKLLQQSLSSYTEQKPLTDILTQEEIGQFIGVRRETINRLLRNDLE
ncbi:Crp/Fnr family transcriptional regulator [Paenibacillus sp. SC116]|uniref:Crp/Fnr family transcriptional regulator n=1 Tax=Paenibacillus sp. SC116 TaxID=2968986 RepID=UPI00215AB669|nr:Crp/Fnr family transcriptional regulator [Paenibacillus sp. SC116]MCR8845324.1 Crp/Fnr family transcriptional regulator [Paenibacillus sp. SC116]